MRSIDPNDLVCMNDFEESHPLVVDLVYAKEKHPENMFKEAIYRSGAKLWLHKGLAEIVKNVSNYLYESYGWKLMLKDGLRTTTAQTKIMHTKICQKHPEWFIAPRLFSPPGAGGHPRGMAVDVDAFNTETEYMIDFGTAFDALPEDRSKGNPAARNYTGLGDTVIRNRRSLEKAFLHASEKEGIEITPLPTEWWDFRYTEEHIAQYAPLSDEDLPPEMRMTSL